MFQILFSLHRWYDDLERQGRGGFRFLLFMAVTAILLILNATGSWPLVLASVTIMLVLGVSRFVYLVRNR